MKKATKIAATWLGILAGFAGLEHGYFEILQGTNAPVNPFFFPSWGPQQCDPTKIWHACEPTMSVLPNFMVTGITTVVLALVIIVWSAAYVQRKHGGLVLTLLSIIFLLAGGGFFPPMIGLAGGVAGMQINRTVTGKPGSITRFMAGLWPWPLVIFVAWSFGQFLIGYFFNDFLTGIMGFSLLLILISLPLSVYVACARDTVNQS
jgi:hypothetical protein